MQDWVPNIACGGHAFGFRKPGQQVPAEFQTFYDHRDDVLVWIKDYSPYEYASADEPTVFLNDPSLSKPAVTGEQ
jgi:hypothetical protein